MLRKSLLILGACGITASAQAADVEVALTEDVIQGAFIMDAAPVGLPGSDLSFGLLFSDDRDIVLSSGLMVPVLTQDVGPGPITVRIGGRAYGALLADPSDDVFALAPGIEGRFALPTGIPTAVVANIFYAPDIVTFGNADDVVDFNTRFEAQFTERVTGFVGFRLLSFDRDVGEDDIVENFQLGIRVAF